MLFTKKLYLPIVKLIGFFSNCLKVAWFSTPWLGGAKYSGPSMHEFA